MAITLFYVSLVFITLYITSVFVFILRKEVLADRFYRQMLFHRCLTAWLSWIEKAKEERLHKEQHDKRAEKMVTLLKAASSGQLWQDKKIEEESESERDAHAVEELVRSSPSAGKCPAAPAAPLPGNF